jgi:O-acetyl-ADP-ribose deacetylase (regulator of RNase III)
MIQFEKGNLLKADVEALVNTVNTVGVMGKGIALQFKETFPDNFKVYQAAVKRGEVRVGSMFVVPLHRMDGVKYIINFPTKEHWRSPSRLSYIEDGLKDLRQVVIDKKIQSIALPPLGCGNGGLDWAEVKPMIQAVMGDLPIKVVVYEPDAAIAAVLQKENEKTTVKLTNPRAMLLHLLHEYRALGEEACEFSAEKLAYFLQRFGEPQLKLDFAKHIYGPYSGKVRHVLYALNGVFIRGFEQKNIRPFDEFELVGEKRAEIATHLESHLSEAEKKRLAQVSLLIDGFQSPYALELLASVDYILATNPSASPEQVRESIAGWSHRKSKMFQAWQIKIAMEHLKGFEGLYAQDSEH